MFWCVFFTDHNDFYHGRVFGELESHVSLHMEDGVITGNIQLPDETYHIEVIWGYIWNQAEH